VPPGELEVGLDRLPGVARVADDQAPHHVDPLPVQGLDRSEGGALPATAALALRVLGPGLQEPQVVIQHVLDPEEDVAEAGAAHERRGAPGATGSTTTSSSPTRTSPTCC